MKGRLIHLLQRPSAGGFTLADVLVLACIAALLFAILNPVFSRG